MIIPVYKPSIQRKEMDYVLSCLVSDEIGPGKLKKDLVKEFCTHFSARGGELFREWNQAILCAYGALGLSEGDSVLMSGLTPHAYYDAALQLGLRPLICDADEATGGVSRESAEPFLDQEPKAVVLFHGAGNLAESDFIRDWELPVIEDISSVYGAEKEDLRSGVWGEVLVIRMESRDLLTCGGGTGVFAKTPKYAKALKAAASSLPETSFLADMNAALGLAQLQSFEKYRNRRDEILDIYIKSSMKTRHKRLVAAEGWSLPGYTMPVIIDGSVSDVRQYCRKKGTDVDLIFNDALILREDLSEAACPQARSLAMRTLAFPVYPSLSGKQIDTVSKILSTLP